MYLSYKEPLLSIVIPSYNHEKFIGDAINSVVSQTVEDLELVIVDDFSVDSSRDIIQGWTKRDGRIRATFHDRNEGIAKTCNDGIKTAKGKYIAMMASDDMFKDRALETILDVLERPENCAGALLEGELIDYRNNTLGLLFSDLHRKPVLKKGNFFKELIKGNFVCTGVVRRSIVDKHKIYYNEDLKYLNDWLFWLDLSHVCNFVYVEEPLYLYRLYGANTGMNYEDMEKDCLRAYDIVLDKYANDLDASSKAMLLRKKATSGIKYSRYSKEDKELLCRYLPFLPSPLERMKTLMMIHTPRLYRLALIEYQKYSQKYGRTSRIFSLARKNLNDSL